MKRPFMWWLSAVNLLEGWHTTIYKGMLAVLGQMCTKGNFWPLVELPSINLAV